MKKKQTRKHTGPLKTLYVIIASCLISLAVFAYSVIWGLLGLYKRERTDKLTRSWATQILNLAGIRRSRVLHEALHFEHNTPYIIMSNHCSLYDIPLIFEALPGSIRMLTKIELRRVPIFGLAMKLNEFVFINRFNREQAKSDLWAAKGKMEDGIMLWVSPEGARSETGKLLRFKRGVFHLALEAHATIIPVGIRGAHRVLPPHTLSLTTDHPVEVHIGKPISTKDYTANDKQLLLKQVETEIRLLLGEQA